MIIHPVNRTSFGPSLALTFALLMLAPIATSAQVIDPDATVSSDGSVPPSTRDAAAAVSPSFEGSADALAQMSAAGMATYGARPATANDLRRFRTAKPRRGGGQASMEQVPSESVIGADGRRRVTNTRAYPARATTFIVFEDRTGGLFSCSGWLVNRNTVVTAGHCVADGNGTPLFPAATYQIAPGYNRNSAPYGVCGARRLYTNATWKNLGRDDYDYAAIKLDCNVGTLTGFYGYSRAVRTRNVITVEGYPGDKASGTQWKMRGRVTRLQARRVFYKIDTFGGQSGSPVWRRIGTRCRACGVAIHAYGVYGPGAPLFFRTNNHGTRITTPVFLNITRWKNAP